MQEGEKNGGGQYLVIGGDNLLSSGSGITKSYLAHCTENQNFGSPKKLTWPKL